MRPKIVLLVLLAGLVGITGIVLLKHPSPPAPAPAAIQEVQSAAPASKTEVVAETPAMPAPVTLATPAPAKAIPVLAVVTPVVTNPAPVPPVVNAVDTNAAHADAVQAQIDKLDDLQANDDPQSFKGIMDQLVNPDKEVRAAAIEATIQFGNRDAIPVLKDLAATTTDSDEKKALLDAAEFLSLPTMTEVHTAR